MLFIYHLDWFLLGRPLDICVPGYAGVWLVWAWLLRAVSGCSTRLSVKV